MGWFYLLFIGAGIAVLAVVSITQRRMRDRIGRAFILGRCQGHYEGWLAHAKKEPLYAMPPRLQEIEQAIGITQGWGQGFYDYKDTDEFAQSGMVGNVTWEEWQARKLRELNETYLGREFDKHGP